MAWLGHDPVRLGELERRLAAAADELDTLASVEPLAASVVGAARHIAFVLRHDWAPIVGAIAIDPSLIEWWACGAAAGLAAPPEPPSGPPADVAAWWESLNASQQRALIDLTPDAIGNTDGIPAWARDRANRAALADDLDHLGALELNGTITDEEAALLVSARAVDRSLADAAAFVDPRTDGSVAVQLYTYDPTAFGLDGSAAIAIGDVDTAQHLAVLVPGMGTEMARFGTSAQQAVFAAASEHTTEGIAVLAWVGYDAPSLSVADGSDDNPIDDAADWVVEVGDLAEVIGLDAATAGAQRLAADVVGLRAIGNAHLTVIGNSYGSTTVAISADEFGLDADDVVLTGSPGAGRAADATDLTTGSANTWVGSASDDPISYLGRTGGAEPHDIVEFVIDGVAVDVDLGLGNDPAEDDFGARRFQAEWPGRDDALPWSIAGHGHYFDPAAEAVGNIGAIVTGHHDAVRLAEPRHKDESWDLWDPLSDLLPVDPEARQPVDSG